MIGKDRNMSNMSLGTYAKILCLSLSREEEEKGEKRRMGGRGRRKRAD